MTVYFSFFALAVYLAVVIAWSYSYRVLYDMQERLHRYRKDQWSKLASGSLHRVRAAQARLKGDM